MVFSIVNVHHGSALFWFVAFAMAWFSGKKSWGNFPDLAGAVNKLQESVKNIEKNFDTALGFEEKAESSSEGT